MKRPQSYRVAPSPLSRYGADVVEVNGNRTRVVAYRSHVLEALELADKLRLQAHRRKG
jgi:hypothetical protein